jgi:hypothetical protein
MKCKKARKLIFEYKDKSLSSSGEKKIRDHFKDCRDCSEVFEKDPLLTKLLKDTMNHRTTSLFIDLSIIDKLKEERKRQELQSRTKRGISLILKPVSLVLVSLIVFLVVLVFYLSNPISKDRAFLSDEEKILEYFDSLVLDDPKTDWIERRLIITIIDEEQETYEKFITSKFPDRIRKYREKTEVIK